MVKLNRDIRIGARFNGKHSFYDYGMYFSKRPEMGQPEPQKMSVQIPGRDGVLDLSEAVTGRVCYNNRTCSFLFVSEKEIADQAEFKSALLNDLHGKTVEVELDEDAGWIYKGRASVSFEDVTPKKAKAAITIDAEPYKVARDETVLTFHLNGTYIDIDSANNASTLTLDETQRDFSALDGVTLAWETAITSFDVVFTDAHGATATIMVGGTFERTSVAVDGAQWATIKSDIDATNILSIKIIGLTEAFSVEEKSTQPVLSQTFFVGNDYGMVVPAFDVLGAGLNAQTNSSVVAIPSNSMNFVNEELYLKSFDNVVTFTGSPSLRGQTVTMTFRKRRL